MKQKGLATFDLYKRGFAAVIVLLIILVAISGVGYLILKSKTTSSVSTSAPSPSQIPAMTLNPTAGWKTYTNVVGGYSLSHPSNWEIQSENLAADSVTTVTILQSADFLIAEPTTGGGFVIGASQGTQLKVVISNNPYIKSYQELKDFYETKSTAYPLNFFASSKEVVVDGLSAMLKMGGKPYRGTLEMGYFYKNGVTMVLLLTSGTAQEQLFNQILSTFHFIN